MRAVLPQIRRPTLIVQRRGDRVVTRGNGRYLADQIPDAVYLELPGVDHLVHVGDADAVVDAVVHFARAEALPDEAGSAQRALTTVLFADMASRLGDQAWSEQLQQFHAILWQQLAVHRGALVDSAGDGLFATFDGPARAIRCAAGLGRALAALEVPLRAGLHTGEVERSDGRVLGLAVHIGARVMAQAGAGEVLVSGTTRDLVAGSGIEFAERGSHALRGIPGEWHLFQALGA